ncbi:TenA family protein [Leptothoe spongobia]|uniref:TenA family protein n=1 Tax=Leptothoe spongobia TAU-MAC 1115 TaxID=1967444 RepID=A0A947DF27_9CYAN|nr:TenA family protein [Leptothoe spongobia]MBT9315484.1 TenA family protein [Leptothoe spongobia TAU-MAC 1115]
MSLSSKLWQEHLDLANESLAHPFVQGIADGTLPKEIFAYYVGQDAFFLEAFARAYSVAAAKSPTWQSFNVFHDLAAGVIAELNLHQNYAQTWNVDLSQVQPGAATLQYTEFLLATAWSQAIDVTAVAMAPCMRLYAYLGQRLAHGESPKHTYKDWISTYSSDEFEPLVAQLESIVDDYAEDSELIQSTYRYAMECERDFFEAAWRSQG